MGIPAPRIESPFVADRVQHFPESVIRGMSRVAAQHGAVNLGQGFPDFDPPREVMEAAKRAIDDGHNQYAVTWGTQALRQALADKLRSFNRIDAHPDQNIVVTCGATEAMMATLLGTVDPGDKVVLFEPFYENFGPDAIVSGASPLFVPLTEPDFQPHEERLKAAFAHKPKAVVVNTPGNPTGRIFTDATLRLIADLCADHRTLAVTDEIYEYLVYDGKRHTSLATVGDMAERTVTVGGFSKTYSVTGWRLGYTAAPKPVTDAIKRVHDFLTVGAPHPLQVAAVAALGLPASYYTELREAYQARRDFLLATLRKAGFACTSPDGAYYILADWTALAEPGRFADDTAFAMWMAREAKVVGIPGSSFFAGGGQGTPPVPSEARRGRAPEALDFHDGARGRHLVRFAYPKRMETLQEAARRLEGLRERVAAREAPSAVA